MLVERRFRLLLTAAGDGPVAPLPANTAVHQRRIGRYTAPMRRFLRYLRIAFSAVFLIPCVLLIALWIRSGWRLDILKIKPPDLQFTAASLKGNLVLEKSDAPWNDWHPLGPWEFTSDE